MEKNTSIVAARVPYKLKELINKYLNADTHLSKSEFLRASIREKIKKDAPHLFEEMMKNGE